MTRQTSIEAYRTIKANGMLSQMRWQVYDHVFNNGPTTSRRTWKAVNSKASTGSVSTRFSELMDMDLFRIVGTCKDEETGMAVLLWDVTDKLPKKITKKLSQYDLGWNHAIEAAAQKCDVVISVDYQFGKAILETLKTIRMRIELLKVGE